MMPTLQHRGPHTQVLRRPEGWSNDDLLYHIYNDLGYRGLRVAQNYTDENGELGFSKWIDYETIMHTAPHEQLPNTYKTRKEFVEGVTHRTILDIEVMLDVDEPAPGFESIKETSAAICAFLKQHGFTFVVHFTGNKSYHISFLVPELREHDHRTRKQLVSWIISESLGADEMKSSENQMIALEGAPHYRSGEPKQEVMFHWGGGPR